MSRDGDIIRAMGMRTYLDRVGRISQADKDFVTASLHAEPTFTRYFPTWAQARSHAVWAARTAEQRMYVAEYLGLPAGERWCVQRVAPLGRLMGVRWWCVDPDGLVIEHG